MYFYLVKRNHTYYYRIRIPADLKGFFPSPEINRSLKTQDFEAAKVLAASWNSRAQRTFALLRSRSLSPDQVPSLTASFYSTKQTNCFSSQTPSSGPNLSKVVALYITDRSPHWTEKSKVEFIKELDVLKRILGDRPIRSISREKCLVCRDSLLKLPTNFTKKKIYRGKSIPEVLSMGDSPTLHPKTINKYLVLLSSVFKWAEKQGYMTGNPAEGLSLPTNKKAEEERKAYDREDLKRIIGNLPKSSETPERYWIPMIAMHSGMRLDEICQLHLRDIVEVDGIWCFDINGNGEKKLKSQSSRRIIPIHPTLWDLGFEEHTEQLRASGESRLWPNLKKDKYGSWGKLFGRWYSGFNRKAVTTDPKKCFHSFRHTVADTLKQSGVRDGVISELLGHSNGNITTGRYGKSYRPDVLLGALRRLDYLG